jgi:hypothetical protein
MKLLHEERAPRMMMPISLGEATPNDDARSFWLRVRPQRRVTITRIMMDSRFLARWELADLRVGGMQPEGWARAFPLTSEIFGLGAFGTRFCVPVDWHQDLSLQLVWLGRIERFPAFLNRQRAWRPCYRNAWWVTRSPPSTMTIRVLAIAEVTDA